LFIYKSTIAVFYVKTLLSVFSIDFGDFGHRIRGPGGRILVDRNRFSIRRA